MKTRVLSVSLAAALAGSLMLAQPAAALTFVDPVNLVQNTLTAIRTLEQINNQINQLQNEAQMLMNQARNLAKLDFNIVNRLRSTLATTERLITEARGQLPNPDRYTWRVQRRHASSGMTTLTVVAERVVAYLHHGSLNPAAHQYFTRPESDADFYATSTFAPPAAPTP